jgi:formate hydrogenlyase transcriptional activator
VKDRALGTLNIGSKNHDTYSEADALFLEEIATQISLSIENMRAYEEIARLKSRLEVENLYLQEEIRTEHNFEDIVGQSQAIKSVMKAIETVAPTDATVLLLGETGTVKNS